LPKFKDFPLPDGVEPIPGEYLRFRVRSRTNPRTTYLVDLEECGFNGACDCPNFQMVHLPKLKADRRDGGPRRLRRCYHIQRAGEFYREVSVRIMARHMNNPDPNECPNR